MGPFPEGLCEGPIRWKLLNVSPEMGSWAAIFDCPAGTSFATPQLPGSQIIIGTLERARRVMGWVKVEYSKATSLAGIATRRSDASFRTGPGVDRVPADQRCGVG